MRCEKKLLFMAISFELFNIYSRFSNIFNCLIFISAENVFILLLGIANALK